MRLRGVYVGAIPFAEEYMEEGKPFESVLGFE